MRSETSPRKGCVSMPEACSASRAIWYTQPKHTPCPEHEPCALIGKSLRSSQTSLQDPQLELKTALRGGRAEQGCVARYIVSKAQPGGPVLHATRKQARQGGDAPPGKKVTWRWWPCSQAPAIDSYEASQQADEYNRGPGKNRRIAPEPRSFLRFPLCSLVFSWLTSFTALLLQYFHALLPLSFPLSVSRC